jgi:probable phosphoglycerate mutase
MLERSRPAAVVSSPVQRARETAELIASRLNRPVQIDPAFVEIDCAGWAGKRFTELRDDPAWRAWNRFRSTAAIPGGETMLAVQARGVAGLVRLSASYPDRELVLVSHADVIKGMLAHFLGASLDLMHRIEIGPGSVSRVALSQDDARILAINVQP